MVFGMRSDFGGELTDREIGELIVEERHTYSDALKTRSTMAWKPTHDSTVSWGAGP